MPLTPDVPDDGKAFYGRDALSNYFIIGMRQMGVDLLAPDANGKAQVNADKEKVRRLWDNYYIPYVSGYFNAVGQVPLRRRENRRHHLLHGLHRIGGVLPRPGGRR